MDGIRPFNEDHADQEAESQQERDQGIVQESFTVTVVHHRLAAIHEEGRDQQQGRHTQSQHLVQMRPGMGDDEVASADKSIDGKTVDHKSDEVR